MKNTTLLALASLGLFTATAQETTSPRNFDHEISLDNEYSITNTYKYFTLNSDSGNDVFINKTGEVGFGLNYKHKVIQKGNYFMHFGFNLGYSTYDYHLEFPSGVTDYMEYLMVRNKFRSGFSKEWYLLNDKLIVEPVLNLTFLTTTNNTEAYGLHTNNEYNSRSLVTFETHNMRRLLPQLQLNVNYQLYKRLYMGLTMKTGLFEELPYEYMYNETFENDNPTLGTYTVQQVGRVRASTKNFYLGFNIAFKY
ncbi:hypothetical protein SAMN05216474_2427 [Lishizhenia tianjinensis]|uniref:Outer membrane protein beta-barrel domain-containing protein n=1 Tax=Lishizhenia tianjinensis TaxID=477690 RepID=A0A1I7AZX0_9FLAO|nr:hypothetical protein [Lishizhenia tianjinensis]SFT80467.1 hypothetical protein SAMN05216474_2427 [Lishizhenia tianjinensis]